MLHDSGDKLGIAALIARSPDLDNCATRAVGWFMVDNGQISSYKWTAWFAANPERFSRWRS